MLFLLACSTPPAADPAPAQPDTTEAGCHVPGSSGPVEQPYSYNYRTWEPEPDGLASIEVFGEPTWTRPTDGPPIDTRTERHGHIPLFEPLDHPRRDGVRLLEIPVIGPGYRRPRQLTVSETHARARDLRDHIMGTPQLDDPPRQLLGEEGLWHLEEDRPLTDLEIAMLPAVQVEHPIDRHYRGIVNHNRTLRRMTDFDGGPGAIQPELDKALARSRARLAEHVAGLFREIDAAGLPPEVRSIALAKTCQASGR